MRILQAPLIGAVAGALILQAACSPGTPAAESTDTTAAAPASNAAGGYGQTDSGLPPDTPVSNLPDGSPAPAGTTSGTPSSASRAAGSSGTAGGGSPSVPSPTAVDTGAPQSPAGAEPAQAPSLNAVIERANAAYQAARTARGTFTQEIVNPQTGTRVRAAGSFMRQQPDKFAFEFSDPQGDRIVADGRYVWLYLPSTNPGQVLRSRLTASTAGSYDLGSLFFERTRERFDVTDGGREVLNGQTTRVLRLVPRGDAPFERATVWVEESSGNLKQFTVVDRMGQERTVRITSYTPNVPVPDSAFRFEPPQGVRVVDTESIGG